MNWKGLSAAIVLWFIHAEDILRVLLLPITVRKLSSGWTTARSLLNSVTKCWFLNSKYMDEPVCMMWTGLPLTAKSLYTHRFMATHNGVVLLLYSHQLIRSPSAMADKAALYFWHTLILWIGASCYDDASFYGITHCVNYTAGAVPKPCLQSIGLISFNGGYSIFHVSNSVLYAMAVCWRHTSMMVSPFSRQVALADVVLSCG